MKKTESTISIFLLFAIVAGISSAYEYDDSESPCDTDKCAAEIHSDLPRCWVQGDNQIVEYLNPMDGGSHAIPTACKRSNIFSGDGYLVAYPSAGGVVLLRSPSAVDLQHLGLPNMYDTARALDEDDDDLATRMVQLGAQWWPKWDLYFKHSYRIHNGIFYDYHFPSRVDVAYPKTGGAWVANFTRDARGSWYDHTVCQSWLPHAPYLYDAKMRYVLTMDDKSEVMKDLGAAFYNSVDEVPGLAKTIEEAISLFEPFDERLNRMEDNDYRQRFCAKEKDEDKDAATETTEKPRWGIWSFFNELR